MKIKKLYSIKTTKFDIKTIGLVIAALLITIQTVALLMMGAKKEGMHIDEYYSYILSNSFDSPKISWDALSWNEWLTGEHFKKFLVVDSGERFAYDTVYYNNSLDAHPPLFYYLLHTVCSVFPERYTMWFGLGLNIGLILATQIVLFLFCKEVTGNTLWGCVPTALYGATQAFFDTAMFIRMYALLALLSVLFVWKHYHLIKRSNKMWEVMWCAGITFLGLFTQYYFAFLAFFVAMATCIHFACRREWKMLVLYAASMLLAVALVFLIYPAGVTQITGSATNNVGRSVMGNLFDFSGWSEAYSAMTKEALKISLSGAQLSFTPLFCVAIIVSFFLGKKHTETPVSLSDKGWQNDMTRIIVLWGILTVVIAVISHISAEFIYVRYIYNLFPLLFLVLSLFLHTTAKLVKLDVPLLAMGVIAMCVISTISLVKNDMCSYLYQARTQRDDTIIQIYEDKPLVLLNNGSAYQPTALMHYISSAEEIYMANYRDFEDPNACFSQVDCSNGVVFIVLTDKKWSNGYNGNDIMADIVNDCAYFNNFKKIGSCSFSTVYLAR